MRAEPLTGEERLPRLREEMAMLPGRDTERRRGDRRKPSQDGAADLGAWLS